MDGEVTQDHAEVDQKTITGESLAVERTKGDKVFAATVVREGKLYIRAERVGAKTTAAQIVNLIANAPVCETRAQNYAEKFADKLVAPSLAFAGSLYAVSGDLDRLLSMAIIDLGAGLRVAAPTSIRAAMTYAARRGIFIKGGNSMEKLNQVDTIVFDKTGTLTRGLPQVIGITSFDERNFPARKILSLAAAAEMRLKHPVACAILSKAHEERVEIPERDDSAYRIGRGVTVIKALRDRGVSRLVMLTGDNGAVASAVASQAGMNECYSEILPAEKADIIQQLQQSGRIVAMVGDGINDSPALAHADVGVAMKNGADVTREAADIVLMEENLWKLIIAVDTSREAINLVGQNFTLIAGLNAVAFALSIPSGIVSPEFTALLSNGSAILASLNAMRPLLRY